MKAPGIVLIVSIAALLLGACRKSPSRSMGADEVRVDVTERGFEPEAVTIPAGRAVTLVMTRKTDQTCAKEVEFESLHQKYALPLNQPVRIALTPSHPGTLSYQCGMHMLSATIMVE